MKKLVLWLTVLVIVVSIIGTFSLSGCKKGATAAEGTSTTEQTATTEQATTTKQATTEETATTEQVKLTWWNIAAPTRSDAYKEVIKRFEAANPNIKIDYQETNSETYRDDLFTAISSGTYPDIMWDWSYENTFQYARNGSFLDLTPYYEAENSAWKNSIIPAALDSFKDKDGKIWGVPFFFQMKMFYYNTEIFKNLNLEVPKTWDEFISVCDKIKASGVTPIALGNLEKWNAMHYIDVLNQKYVGEATFEADEVLSSEKPFTDEGYVKALDTLKLLVDKYMNKDPNGVDYAASRVLFYSGKTAMIYDGLWQLGYYAGLSKEVPEEFWNKWDYFVFPDITGTKGDPNYIHGGCDAGWVVSSKCKYPDAAVKFLKFFTSPEIASYIVKTTGENIPVIGAVNSENSIAPLIRAVEIIAKAKGAIPWEDIVMEASLAELQKNEIQAVVGGEKTSKDAMDAMIKKAAELKK